MCDLVPCLADMAKKVGSPDRHPLAVIDIEKLLSIIIANIDAMAATVVFLAEGTRKCSFRIKDHDRVHHLGGLGSCLT